LFQRYYQAKKQETHSQIFVPNRSYDLCTVNTLSPRHLVFGGSTLD